MEKSNSTFLDESLINEKINQYMEFYKKEYNKLIKDDLPQLAYDFLDNQAIKEKETQKNILNHNRRAHKDFIQTSKNFFENNFSYISQILYIRYLISHNYFIGDLKQYLNKMVENILNQNDIKKLISNCFLKKFKQYEEDIKNKTPELMNKFDYKKSIKNISENEDEVSSSSKDEITNNNKEDNLPPANGILEYPDESEISFPSPTKNKKKQLPKEKVKEEKSSIKKVNFPIITMKLKIPDNPDLYMD